MRLRAVVAPRHTVAYCMKRRADDEFGALGV